MPVTDHLQDCWQGRIDREEPDLSRRLHQHVEYAELPSTFAQSTVLLGFASDEGVRRNQGRTGAREGPVALRQALANLACSPDTEVYDAGDVRCHSNDLETAQQACADVISELLRRDARPLILGGGHEVAWASFSGLQQYLRSDAPDTRLGILNFDAHFDLRNPEPLASSGTPFRQAQQWCAAHDRPFDYFVCGLNPSANTDALFDFAYENQVQWVEDMDCHWGNISVLKQQLRDWLKPLDALYLTVCLDVFSAAHAPGVSAPAALGIEPALMLKLLQFVQEECEQTGTPVLLADVAELNPLLDPDQRTARLAARVLYQLMF